MHPRKGCYPNRTKLDLIGITLLLFSFCSQINAATLALSPELKDFNAAKYISFIEDPNHELSIDDVIDSGSHGHSWTTNGDEVINFGYTTSTFWFKLELNNISDHSLYRLIEVSYPMLNEATAYYFVGNKHLSTLELGNAKPFKNRILDHRHFVYPVELPPNGKRTIYFKAWGTFAVHFPIQVWDESTFWQHDQYELFVQCMYFGLMLVMIIYHLFIAWSTRDSIYIKYIAFLLLVGGFSACYRGFAYQYLWPDFPQWNAMSHILLTPVCNIVTILFSIDLLRLKNNLPTFYKILVVFASCSTITLPCFLFINETIIIAFVTFIIMLTANVLLVAGYLCWQKGRIDARIFTIAYSIFLTGCSLLALNKFGLLPFNHFTELSLQLGSAVETILLSLALAFRIKRMRKDSLNLVRARLYAQEKRIRAIQELKEGVAKTQFLAIMSHEIRTPLNGVLGLVEILKESPLSQKQQTLVKTIQSSGEMLLSITNDILDFSKTESGSINIEKSAVSLSQLVDECGLIYSIKATNKGFPLFTYIAPNVPDIIQTDRTKLKQVLSNLLGNAFKFTDEGFVLLYISAHNRENQSFIRIEVIDTGIGINKQEQIKLFQSFSQANQSTTRQYGGTGLGLAISKKIINALEGQVGIESDTGKGSNFWFEVPVDAQPLSLSYKAISILLITDKKYFTTLFNKLNDHDQFILHTALVDDPHNIELPKVEVDKVFILINGESILKDALFSKAEEEYSKASDIYFIESHLDSLSHDFKSSIAEISSPIALHRLFNGKEQQSKTEEKVRTSADVPESVRQLRVLVAEDNPVNQMVVKGLIKPFVAELHLVPNGLEAVNFFKAHRHELDLIFMDCEMPEMDGYEATKAIREHESAMKNVAPIKIVALTAHAFQQFRDKAFESGMDEHLTKPINASILKRFFIEHYDNFGYTPKTASTNSTSK